MPVETVDLAGAADEWCSVHVPSLACEGCMRAAVHVGQSRSAQHAQCVPNVQYLPHICRPLVQKPVFLGHGKAMASVLCRLSMLPSPWATPDPEQVSLLFACPTSKRLLPHQQKPTSQSTEEGRWSLVRLYPGGLQRRRRSRQPWGAAPRSRRPGRLSRGMGWDRVPGAGLETPAISWPAIRGREICSDSIMFVPGSNS